MLYGASVLWKVHAKICAPSQICCFFHRVVAYFKGLCHALLLFLPRLVAYFKKDYVILKSVYKEELCYMGPQYYEKFMQIFAHLPTFVAFPSQSWFTKGSFAIWDISIVKSSCINLRTFPDLLLFQYPTRPLHYPTRPLHYPTRPLNYITKV